MDACLDGNNYYYYDHQPQRLAGIDTTTTLHHITDTNTSIPHFRLPGFGIHTFYFFTSIVCTHLYNAVHHISYRCGATVMSYIRGEGGRAAYI